MDPSDPNSHSQFELTVSGARDRTDRSTTTTAPSETTSESTTTTTGSDGDGADPHTVSSWNQLDAEGRSQLSEAQLALLDQAADGWAEWDRSLPAQKHAFFSFPTAGVYPYFDRQAGLNGASGAVVVGDATLDVELPSG